MTPLNRTLVPNTNKYPIRIIQFGTGNFLRAFVDYTFYVLNTTCQTDYGIVAVQSTPTGLSEVINRQEGLFTLITQGIESGKPVARTQLIDTLVRAITADKDYEAFLKLAHEPQLKVVVSNTTESGIVYNPDDTQNACPPDSFPAKLTVFLFERFHHFKGSEKSGLIFLPCELIDQNAATLKSLILRYSKEWNLGHEFNSWIHNANVFCNTLVDRIVSGYPKNTAEELNKNLGYTDELMVCTEPFFLWVIEAEPSLKSLLPFDRTPLDVKIVADLSPYQHRKVRILNGAHTAMVPIGILQGISTVGDCMLDNFTFEYIQDLLFKEVIPTLNQDKEELEHYARQVLDRFRNPFIAHQLSGIALNSVSKFKVRLLPSLLAYYEANEVLPLRLTFAFAALLLFYKGEWENTKLPVHDDPKIKQRFYDIWENNPMGDAILLILRLEKFWGMDLSLIPKLADHLILAGKSIDAYGIREGWEKFK